MTDKELIEFSEIIGSFSWIQRHCDLADHIKEIIIRNMNNLNKLLIKEVGRTRRRKKTAAKQHITSRSPKWRSK